MKLDLDKSDEQIVNEFDDLKDLQKLGRRLFELREAAYQRRLVLQVEIDKKQTEQDRIDAEKLTQKIQDENKKKSDAERIELKNAIISEVQKIMKEATK